MSAKDVILAAIYFKGVDQVKKEAADLAEKSFCSTAYVKRLIRNVESRKIIFRK